MIKYILIPGRVQSTYDGDIHYISAPQLARLYGVPMEECITAGVHDVEGRDLIALYPMPSGDYDKVRNKRKDREMRTPDEQMVDRVAFAMYPRDIRGNYEKREDWPEYQRMAREAIAAMQPEPIPLMDSKHDAAMDWVTKNLGAIRRDDGSMIYNLTQMIRAFEAGEALTNTTKPKEGKVEHRDPDACHDLARTYDGDCWRCETIARLHHCTDDSCTECYPRGYPDTRPLETPLDSKALEAADRLAESADAAFKWLEVMEGKGNSVASFNLCAALTAYRAARGGKA